MFGFPWKNLTIVLNGGFSLWWNVVCRKKLRHNLNYDTGQYYRLNIAIPRVYRSFNAFNQTEETNK